jgi:hypothetical protein
MVIVDCAWRTALGLVIVVATPATPSGDAGQIWTLPRRPSGSTVSRRFLELP